MLDMAVGTGGAGDTQNFGRSVNPIFQSGGILVCPPHYYSPPGFSDLPTSLIEKKITCVFFLIIQVYDIGSAQTAVHPDSQQPPKPIPNRGVGFF